MMTRTRILAFAFAAACLLAAVASARADFPVSGTWTYDSASLPGPAKRCGNRQMQFAGLLRYDTETAAPEYRNLSVTRVDAATWRLVDQFYTAVVWGKVYYTLRRVDDDHIVIHLDKGGHLNTGGASWMLRRCG